MLLWSALFVFSLLLQYATFAAPQRALAVHDAGLFELDGNAVDGSGPGDDWDKIYAGTSAALVTEFITDPTDSSTDDTFTGGSTKDDLPLSGWLWKKAKATPIKNDIANAFAALYTNSQGDKIAYFGLDKIEADGNNFAGFWFFQGPVGLTGNGQGNGSPFIGSHTVGDILVLANYTNGGRVASFDVYKWVGSGGDVNGTLQTVATGVECGTSSGDDACGITNGSDESAPWPFEGRDRAAGTFGPGTFFEGGLNLNALGLGGSCFTSFMAETRSSQSVDATLSDFALGSFDTCGSVKIIKNAVPDDPQAFSFTQNIDQSGGFSLVDGGSAGTNTKVFDRVNPGTYTVSEAELPPGWKLTDIKCNDADSTVDVQGRTATIRVAATEDVTCTFTNTKLAKLVVKKVTSPSGASGTFSFSGAVSGSIGDGGTISSGFLDPGTYQVTEADPTPPFDLGAINCDDGNSTGDVAKRTATYHLEPGETVTCTFTNVERGTITIIKDAIPNDGQAFGFSGDLGSFSLVDNGGNGNTETFLNVKPGSYTVTEGAVSGWDLTGVSCNGTGGSSGSQNGNAASITLTPGGSVTCTFTNTKRGTIIVEKQTNPDGDPATFAFSGDVAGNLGDGGQASASVAPGTYTSKEAVPAGWDLTDIRCDDSDSSGNLATATATFHVAPGETVTCTFTNTKRGHIIVDKVTDPSGDPASFDFSLSGGPDSVDQTFSLTDQATPHDSGALKPGTYSVAETPLDGWDLTSAVCSDESDPSEIDLAPGETVTCVFTNTKRGSITIVKDAVPNDSQAFGFTGDLGSFSLVDDGSGTGNSKTFTNLVPGTYGVAETPLAGWDLTGAVCSDESDPSEIDLGPGEHVTCTFTNTKRGHIIVDKVTDPSGDPASFDFSLSGGPDSVDQTFSLTDQATPHDSGALKPGTYSVAETPLAGWDLTGAVCSGENDPSQISLGPGETVTCTFTNTKRGTIIVEKQTSPAGATDEFSFTGDAAGSIADGEQIVVPNLKPGTYTSTEADPGSDWDLGAIVCDDSNSTGDVASRTATFKLDPGETVTCTFTNVQRGTITIIKDAVPNDPQDFSFTQTIDESGGFSLVDDGTGTKNTKTFEHVVAGDYSVTEAGVGGWDLTGVECNTTGGSTATRDGMAVDIHLTTGGSVTCVFTNTKRGSITIVKDAVPNDAQPFDFSGDLGDFSLVDNGTEGANTKTFTNLVPGMYSVNETPVPGWDLTGATCSDESDPSEIDLGPGEHVTCTFTNERPSISVTKTAGNAADGATYTTLAGPVTYTYVVTNTGPVALENISVTDDNGTPSDTSDDFAADCPKTTLDPGESMTCSKTVSVATDRTNTATAHGFSAQGTEVSDTDTAVVVIRHPDTGIAKSYDDADGIVGPGQVVTYTLTVQVVQGPVTNAVVTDALPDGQTYVSGSQSSSPSASFSVSADGRTLTWTFPSLPTGNPAATISYQVTIDQTAATGTQTNVAEVCVSELSACKTDESTVTVPALVIAKSLTGNSQGTDPLLKVPKAAEGDTLTYTLTYTLTNGPVTGAVITDTLPAGLTYVTGSATGNDEFSFTSFDSTTRTLRWDAATATKSGSVTYQVVVAAGAAEEPQPLVNTAVIDSNETNPDEATASVAVAPPPLAATATPRVTPPATDTLDLPASNPGSMLMIALLIIAAVALVVGLLTPAPARATRRDHRR